MNIHRRQEHTDRYFLGKADFFRKPLLVDTWSWFINQVGFLSGGALCKQSCCVLQQLPREYWGRHKKWSRARQTRGAENHLVSAQHSTFIAPLHFRNAVS